MTARVSSEKCPILGCPMCDGVSGVFIDVDDVRAHGKDERIGVKEFDDGVECIYELIRALSTK